MKDKIMMISLGGCLVVIGFLGILLYKSYDSNSEKSLHFENGYYTNKVGTRIKEDDYKILALTNSFDTINTISEYDMNLVVDYYYSNMEAYKMYDYVGEYEDTSIKAGTNNEIKVVKLTTKRLPITNIVIEENVNENYCVVGEDKYGNYILATYEDNTCDITQLVCDILADTNNKSYIDNCSY